MARIILQKFIANSGYCSRRKAEALVKGGRVAVNGKIAESGQSVEGIEKIMIDGKLLAGERKKVYLILNKPRGYTCTNKKFLNEKNIFELLPSDLKKERLVIAGRLDKESRGLVALTNDGDWANRITHPRYGHEKEYIVKLKVQSEKLKVKEIETNFIKGVDIGEGDGIVKAERIGYSGGDKFKIVLASGKKRQIRRMFKELGCEVADLLRIRIGSIHLGNIKEGEIKKIKK